MDGRVREGIERCEARWADVRSSAVIGSIGTLLMIACFCSGMLPRYVCPLYGVLAISHGLLMASMVRRALVWWDLRNRWRELA